jgi:hypothetical protein
MTTLPHSDQHRVTALARQMREGLASVARTPLWSMTGADAAHALVLLTRGTP